MAFDHSGYGKVLQQLSDLGIVRRDSVTYRGRYNTQKEIISLLGQLQTWVAKQPVEAGLTRAQRNKLGAVDSGETQA